MKWLKFECSNQYEIKITKTPKRKYEHDEVWVVRAENKQLFVPFVMALCSLKCITIISLNVKPK